MLRLRNMRNVNKKGKCCSKVYKCLVVRRDGKRLFNNVKTDESFPAATKASKLLDFPLPHSLQNITILEDHRHIGLPDVVNTRLYYSTQRVSFGYIAKKNSGICFSNLYHERDETRFCIVLHLFNQKILRYKDRASKYYDK